MAKFYTLEERKPRKDKLFLFLSKGKLYFGLRGKFADIFGYYYDNDLPVNVRSLYYYKLYFNVNRPKLCTQPELLDANAMGQRIIDGWFYYPSTKNINMEFEDTMPSEISQDQTTMEESDGLAGFRDYWRRRNGVSLSPAECEVHSDSPGEIVRNKE